MHACFCKCVLLWVPAVVGACCLWPKVVRLAWWREGRRYAVHLHCIVQLHVTLRCAAASHPPMLPSLSGAVAERCKFECYVLYNLCLVMFV